MKQILYHGTDTKTAEKIIKEGTLSTTGYLGVGVCYTLTDATHYAKHKRTDDGCVVVFEVVSESVLKDACICREGGISLHDEIGRPLKELKIFNAKILDVRKGKGVSAIECSQIGAHSFSDMPEPLRACIKNN